MTRIKVSALAIVQESWGVNAPEWIVELAKECDLATQVAVAGKIGRAPSLINMVLRRRYPGSLANVEERFNAVFKSGELTCPVLGNISGEKCLGHRNAGYRPSNHIAVRLFCACQSCPNNPKAGVRDAS